MRVTQRQARDSGLAATLILLLAALYTRDMAFVLYATGCLVAAMAAPPLFKPFAVLWYGLSEVLGKVANTVLLGLVFFGIVFPIGLLMRLFGKDPMRLRAWRAGSESLFVTRNRTFAPSDIHRPF